MDGLVGRFEIDGGVDERQAHGAPAIEAGRSEHLAESGQQGAERGVGIVWAAGGPQRFDDLGTGNLASSVHDEVGEQDSSLAAGERGFDPGAVELDDDRSADLDARRARLQGFCNVDPTRCPYNDGRSGRTTWKVRRD